MTMARVSRGSLSFLLTCVDCDAQLTVNTADGTGFSAARIASGQRGWTFVRSLTRCGRCSKAATRRPPASRNRRP